jgi:hypothetical protein
MTRLQKWDRKVLLLGNGVQWLSLFRYRKKISDTQKTVIGAWGRKRNIIWMGSWKGSNA